MGETGANCDDGAKRNKTCIIICLTLPTKLLYVYPFKYKPYYDKSTLWYSMHYNVVH